MPGGSDMPVWAGLWPTQGGAGGRIAFPCGFPSEEVLMGKRLTAGALLLFSAGLGGVCAIPATFADTPAGKGSAAPSPATAAADGAAPAEVAAAHIAGAAATPPLFDPAR